MAYSHPNKCDIPLQAPLRELQALFEVLDPNPIFRQIRAERYNGRPGYVLRPLWRAYVASFFFNLPHTNALIRMLHGDAELRSLCGFGDELPHRATFNRFIRRLSHYPELIEDCFAKVTGRLKELLPDLGEEVAIDSTTVRTHSNPNRRTISDPEASWTAKTSAQAKKGGTEWYFGYKFHVVVDANHGLPLSGIVTTAKQTDFHMLMPGIDRAHDLHEWFKPQVAIADKGYDAGYNYDDLVKRDVLPIIAMRRNANGRLHEGIYATGGIPTCLGQVPMQYVASHPEFGHLFRCRSEGCHLAGSLRGGTSHCDTEVWEVANRNPRMIGAIPRSSPEWQRYYVKRQAIERTFKSMKESRRLNRHCVRGLRQVRLHALMSMLVYQATALVRILAGEAEQMRWMVRPVA